MGRINRLVKPICFVQVQGRVKETLGKVFKDANKKMATLKKKLGPLGTISGQ